MIFIHFEKTHLTKALGAFCFIFTDFYIISSLWMWTFKALNLTHYKYWGEEKKNISVLVPNIFKQLDIKRHSAAGCQKKYIRITPRIGLQGVDDEEDLN